MKQYVKLSIYQDYRDKENVYKINDDWSIELVEQGFNDKDIIKEFKQFHKEIGDRVISMSPFVDVVGIVEVDEEGNVESLEEPELPQPYKMEGKFKDLMFDDNIKDFITSYTYERMISYYVYAEDINKHGRYWIHYFKK